MRWIQKKGEPSELTEWRTRCGKDINFGYDLMRQDSCVTQALTEALLKEQGCLCAYTGMRIDGYVNLHDPRVCYCHLEHVKPQGHCTLQETVSYTNLVACYPKPNPKAKIPYGAEQKGNWPPPAEQHLFVSPLDPSCEIRFLFNLGGGIKSKEGDQAAATTIRKLALDHHDLTAFRRAAIQGTLGTQNNLSIKDARKRLKALKSNQHRQPEPFCFTLAQVLEKRISKLEEIAKSKRAKK
ncbi:hypothetical protein ACKFKG_00060 [Phormidesmis sp. 146-35]